MPIFTFVCPHHGEFDQILPSLVAESDCPVCGHQAEKALTAPARISVQRKERLPYGEGSRGRMVSHKETGGMGILVPSFGSMEKEEVDYVTEMAVQKEKERVKKNPRVSQTKAKIGALMDLAYHTKEGQRFKTIKAARADI